MIIFGLVYYMLPKITGKEIGKSAKSFHFWTSALASSFFCSPTSSEDLLTGPRLNNHLLVVIFRYFSVQPYFIITKYAFVILGFSQLVFVVNVWKVIFPNPFACCFASDSESKGKTA